MVELRVATNRARPRVRFRAPVVLLGVASQTDPTPIGG